MLNNIIMLCIVQDNAVGKGTGFYQKKRLFHAKKGHASLVPVIGLYYDTQESPPAYCTPSPPPEFGKYRSVDI